MFLGVQTIAECQGGFLVANRPKSLLERCATTPDETKEENRTILHAQAMTKDILPNDEAGDLIEGLRQELKNKDVAKVAFDVLRTNLHTKQSWIKRQLKQVPKSKRAYHLYLTDLQATLAFMERLLYFTEALTYNAIEKDKANDVSNKNHV